MVKLTGIGENRFVVIAIGIFLRFIAQALHTYTCAHIPTLLHTTTV